MQITVFDGPRRVASGTVAQVAAAAQATAAAGRTPLVLNDATGRAVDLDLRGTPEEVAARHAPPPRRGRPRLGVASREISLLPRHWDWIAKQRGGASATLRRLVETAMRGSDDATDMRARHEAAYHAATVLAGDLPGYEEAMRRLFAGDLEGLADQARAWPEDIRAYVLARAAAAPVPTDAG